MLLQELLNKIEEEYKEYKEKYIKALEKEKEWLEKDKILEIEKQKLEQEYHILIEPKPRRKEAFKNTLDNNKKWFKVFFKASVKLLFFIAFISFLSWDMALEIFFILFLIGFLKLLTKVISSYITNYNLLKENLEKEEKIILEKIKTLEKTQEDYEKEITKYNAIVEEYGKKMANHFNAYNDIAKANNMINPLEDVNNIMGLNDSSRKLELKY